MKRFFLAATLLFAGCGVETDLGGNSHFVWVNQSDHVIRIAGYALTGWDEENRPIYGWTLDRSLQKGEQAEYDQIGGMAHNPWPSELDFQRLEVSFDGQITVPYVRSDSSPRLEAPKDLSPDYNLLYGHYVERQENSKHKMLTTWTYTFTNADYEAAKAWSEKQ